jgi:ADP-heptose:LPS heptosyltransferase
VKISTMRRLDRALGIPGAAIGTAAVKLAASRTPVPGPPRKILFVKLVEQGTTVLARPAFEAAAARVGGENVFCLTLEENRGILDVMGMIPERNVIAVPGSTPWAIVRGLAGAIRRIRRLGVDAVVDLEFFARATAVIASLTGAPVRVGMHPGPGAGPWRGDLFTHRVLYQADLHTSQLFAMLVSALDYPPDSLPTLPFVAPPRERWSEPTFHPTPGDLRRVEELLGGRGGGRLFVLNANAGDLEPLRRWPPERYVELAGRLLGEYAGSRVVFCGAPAEAATTDGLASRVASARCSSLAGRTSLRELFGVLSLCDVLVSNDSGPAHFACLTPSRVVVLFGPESPRRFGPLSVRAEAISAGLACSPCLSAYNNRRSGCRDNVCMQRIGVPEVLSAIGRLLA